MNSSIRIILGVVALSIPVLGGLVQTGGVGIGIRDRSHTGEPLTIGVVFPGSPAALAGVTPNWFVISVNGSNVVTIPFSDCMGRVCGQAGTPVILELADPLMKVTNRVTIIRANVPLPDRFLPSEPLRLDLPPGSPQFDPPPDGSTRSNSLAHEIRPQ